MPYRRSEKSIEDQIKDLLRESGAWFFKVHGGPMQEPGVPDILACLDGRFIALEVKRPGEQPTPKQALILRKIAAAGGVAAVVTSANEARAVLIAEKLINA